MSVRTGAGFRHSQADLEQFLTWMRDPAYYWADGTANLAGGTITAHGSVRFGFGTVNQTGPFTMYVGGAYRIMNNRISQQLAAGLLLQTMTVSSHQPRSPSMKTTILTLFCGLFLAASIQAGEGCQAPFDVVPPRVPNTKACFHIVFFYKVCFNLSRKLKAHFQ